MIVHNAVDDGDDPSTRDVLAQVEWVAGGLAALAIPYEVAAVGEDGPDAATVIGAGAVVFNLVESPPGRPAFQVTSARRLESFGVPHTGSRAAAIELTTDKIATRGRLTGAGLTVASGGRLDPAAPMVLTTVPPPWILKPALEDASLGLDGAAVTSDPAVAVARARELETRFGQPVLVEHLLPGREFNLSLLASGNRAGPQVLPAAEMQYLDFPPELPQVLDWAAKWDDDSFVARHTVRRFLPAGSEPGLEHRLAEIARAAWHATGVSGYARVDLRLDETGTPCVLEVNANPCLSGDAGYVAAAAAAGLDAAAVVARVLADAEHAP